MSNSTDKKIEHAHQEWLAALDVLDDPIFLHDKEFRVLRCNLAYQQCAGLPFTEIIGRPYFDVFPRTRAPLRHCLEALEKTSTEGEEEVQVGGTFYRSRSYAIKDEKGNYLYSVHTLEDITERRRIQQTLRESEIRYRRLFETAKDGILLLDAETGAITDANPFILNLISYRLDECIGRRLWEIGLFTDIEADKTAFRELLSKGYIRYEDLPLETKNGRRINVEFVSKLYKVNGREMIQCNIRDITEHRLSEEALQEARLGFKAIFDSAHDGILVADRESRKFFSGNARICTMLGYSPEELLSLSVEDIHPPKDLPYVLSQFERQARGEIELAADLPVKRKDGSLFFADVNSFPIVISGKEYVAGFFRDITERKQAEEQLKLFHALLDHSGDAIEVLDPSTLNFLDVNDTECRTLGYSREELLSMNVYDIDPELTEEYAHAIEAQMRQSEKFSFEGIHRRKDGSTFPVEISLTLIQLDKPYILSIARDISERKATEAALSRANHALRTLSAANLALVKAESEDDLLQEVASVIIEKGGYSFSLVYYAEDEPPKIITPMAWAGTEANFFREKSLSWADTEEGQLPISRAIRTGTTQICREIPIESVFKGWRDADLSRSHCSNIAIPISGDGRTFGALSIYSSEAEPFDEEEVKLLEELARDLAYGIATLRTRIAHTQQATILQQSLEQSIMTIAATLEARDPYTAGHQRRVGELATAIARKMGLPEKQVQGIHFASLIHDMGKIHVPAEILSKPGKLSEIEYKLIQIHPQAGYEILKDVRFPWPIAEIIRQHHERLDGSGYPQGLKADQILAESKIIAVADVVEAMASHRPYRPAMGIDLALNEIRRGRNILYTPLVVDACLKLFTEKEFIFSNEDS